MQRKVRGPFSRKGLQCSKENKTTKIFEILTLSVVRPTVLFTEQVNSVKGTSYKVGDEIDASDDYRAKTKCLAQAAIHVQTSLLKRSLKRLESGRADSHTATSANKWFDYCHKSLDFHLITA